MNVIYKKKSQYETQFRYLHNICEEEFKKGLTGYTHVA
jgi:hypothetical protein